MQTKASNRKGPKSGISLLRPNVLVAYSQKSSFFGQNSLLGSDRSTVDKEPNYELILDMFPIPNVCPRMSIFNA